MSTPSLDLESHVKLDMTGEASLTPQFGGIVLDQDIVFAVRLAEPAEGFYANKG